MNSDWALWLTLYVASGALIGGVVTPVVTANKRLNEWLAMLLGVVVGAITHLFGLIVLWIVLSRQQNAVERWGRWQRDSQTLEEALAGRHRPAVPPRERAGALAATLRANWWPAARAGHSHRMTYVGVFVALAVITAIEVLLTVASLPFSPVGPLIMLSTIKVLLVALFFMHLIYDSKWYALMFISALPFSIMIIIILAVA